MFDDYLREQGIKFVSSVVAGLNEISKKDCETWNTK